MAEGSFSYHFHKYALPALLCTFQSFTANYSFSSYDIAQQPKLQTPGRTRGGEKKTISAIDVREEKQSSAEQKSKIGETNLAADWIPPDDLLLPSSDVTCNPTLIVTAALLA